MKRTLNALVILFALALSGCAATVQRQAESSGTLDVSPAAASKLILVVRGSTIASASEDWEPLRVEWRAAMQAATAEKGVDFAYQENANAPVQGAGTLVIVKVKDYRYLSAGARFGLGIMTGNAFMDADATFLELPSRKRLGTRQYNTSSSAWQGVFSAMTSKQLRSISDEIVMEVAQDR